MRFRFCILIVASTIFLVACTALKRERAQNLSTSVTPPGTIQIDTNLYCDEWGVTNMDWLEYLYWLSKIFGDTSEEYLSALPLNYKADIPFNHPDLRKDPITGITQEQAEQYSRWRSDRVFESLLLRHKIICWDTAQNSGNYFTIERFYQGLLTNRISYVSVDYYPEYRLPTFDERRKILQFAESGTKKSSYLLNLHSKVHEWSVHQGVAFRGTSDTLSQNNVSDTIRLSGANLQTGFRNVCSWKKWQP